MACGLKFCIILGASLKYRYLPVSSQTMVRTMCSYVFLCGYSTFILLLFVTCRLFGEYFFLVFYRLLFLRAVIFFSFSTITLFRCMSNISTVIDEINILCRLCSLCVCLSVCLSVCLRLSLSLSLPPSSSLRVLVWCVRTHVCVDLLQ